MEQNFIKTTFFFYKISKNNLRNTNVIAFKQKNKIINLTHIHFYNRNVNIAIDYNDNNIYYTIL